MWNRILRLISFIGLVMLFPYLQQYLFAGDCPTAKNIPLRLETQKTSTWCWATTAKIVMDYKGMTEMQCFIVDAVRQNQLSISSPPTCCVNTPETILNCMRTSKSEVALKEFRFSYRSTNETEFTWSDLQKQICSDRPVIYGEDYWDDEGGHEYILKGFREASDGKKWVVVYDPLDDPINNYIEKSYDDWLRLPSSGRDPYRKHVEYYFNIQR